MYFSRTLLEVVKISSVIICVYLLHIVKGGVGIGV